MPRFVILRHEPGEKSDRGLHWDLMLEEAASLLTWALDEPFVAGKAMNAVRLPNHRKAYLTFEGAVSNERGEVTRVDEGHFRWIDGDATAAEFRIGLTGKHVRGELHFQLIEPGDQRWVVLLSG